MSLDLSGISTYSDMYSNNTSETTSAAESATSKDFSNATDDELMDACKEFESYFTEQVFKALQKMVPENEDNTMSSSSTSMLDYAKEQLTTKYASESTEQGSGLGLAQMLYEQMKRNYGTQE